MYECIHVHIFYICVCTHEAMHQSYICTYIHAYIHTRYTHMHNKHTHTFPTHRNSRQIIDMDPISITKHQVTCELCNQHRMDCLCKCAVCPHTDMHACHFMCAVPSQHQMMLKNKSGSVGVSPFSADLALHKAVTRPSPDTSVLSSNSAPLAALFSSREGLCAEPLVTGAVRKKSIFARIRFVRYACVYVCICIYTRIYTYI
jgi:hypothetical protein